MNQCTVQEGNFQQQARSSIDAQTISVHVQDEQAVNRHMTRGTSVVPIPCRDEHGVIIENVQQLASTHPPRHDDKAWRLRQGGYPGPQGEMNIMPDREMNYPYHVTSRRPWPPTSYQGGRGHHTWGPPNNSSGVPYDVESDVQHHREPIAYFNARGMGSGGHGRHYDGQGDPHVYFEQDNRKYDNRHWPASHAYVPAVPPYHPEVSEQLTQSSVHPNNLPPPLSTQIQHMQQAEVRSSTQVQHMQQVDVRPSTQVQHMQQADVRLSTQIPHMQQANMRSSTQVPHVQQADMHSSTQVQHMQQEGVRLSTQVQHMQQADVRLSTQVQHMQQADVQKMKQVELQSLMVASETKEVEERMKNGGPRQKQPLQLDACGLSTGKMASLFQTDIVSYSKEMNPVEGWDGQTADARNRIIGQLWEQYEIQAEGTPLSLKYLKKAVGTALIHRRHNLNQLIDKGVERPKDVHPDFWEALKKKRETKESIEKSEKMASIAKVRATKHSSRKALQQAAILRLTLELEREPNNAEIEEAVQKDMIVLQQEVTNKRRLKGPISPTSIGVRGASKLHERLEVLESFMWKWSSRLEEWNSLLSEEHGRHFEDAKNAKKDANEDKREHCDAIFTGDDENKENNILNTIEQPSDSEESKDSDDLEIESEDSEGEALHEVQRSMLPHVVDVVEQNSAKRPKDIDLHHGSVTVVSQDPHVASNGGLDSDNWSEVLTAGTVAKSSSRGKQVTAVRFSARTAEKAQKAVEQAQISETLSRPSKRAKQSTNSENNPMVVDEDSAEDLVKGQESTTRTTKVSRSRGGISTRKKETIVLKKDKGTGGKL